MGTLTLVRHGQASFGSDDYDRLSPLGEAQCRRLGEYLQNKGVRFDAALVGTLRRHDQSFAALCAGLESTPARTDWPGLNEYDAEALVSALEPRPALTDMAAPEARRQHFRALRNALQAWMEDSIAPPGMCRYSEFVAGVTAALDHVRQSCNGQVLLVSSGGPIATAVGQVLGMTPAATIELNMRIRNSAITEFVFTPKRHALLTFNTLPHLDSAEHADWITYA
jgi:broad specificity phosphatase PhoE